MRRMRSIRAPSAGDEAPLSRKVKPALKWSLDVCEENLSSAEVLLSPEPAEDLRKFCYFQQVMKALMPPLMGYRHGGQQL